MCFLLKKFLKLTKKLYLYDRFFMSNRIFTTEHVEIVKKHRFFQVFLVSQVPGFSMFPGKVATLLLIIKFVY